MNDDNSLARSIIARQFSKIGWPTGSDREHTIDVACRFWTEGKSSLEAAEEAKRYLLLQEAR